jgi:DNA-binding SARP family transcriptional activator
MSSCIRLFGAVQFTWEGKQVKGINSNRLRSLLAFLVLRAEAPQSREQLAALIWPDSDEGQARTNLRQLLHHFRRALPDDCALLVSDGDALQWQRSPACAVDVYQFDRALEQAVEAARRGDTATERAALKTAVELYQEDLARELFDDWLIPLREHYRQEFAYVLGKLAVLFEDDGDYEAAIRHAERLVAQDALREAHHQLLIRLHIANHDRAGALRAYYQCMRVLRKELAVDPDPVTRELYQRALKSPAPGSSKHAGVPLRAAGSTPIVGRERELKQLIDCWPSVECGNSRLVVITGEPGVGKSRLADELYDWCAAQRDGAVARARCYAAQGQLGYAPISEWLRAGPLRASLSQLPRMQLEELVRVLPEILPDGSAMARSLPSNDRWQRRRFFEALHAAFIHAPRPLLLLIDDLQWSDPDTIDYLHALLRSGQVDRILVVATMRAEETDRNHPATKLRQELARIGRLTEVPLKRLSAPETATLATRIAGCEITEADLTDLYRTTKGNPLFVVECIRAGLHTSEAIRRIDAVISARLAQLSPGAYELAGWAAAVGQSFSFDLLAKATDWDEDSLSRALDELWQRRLIETLRDAEYDFTHDRIREVAQAESSPIRRHFFHRRIARALEELHPSDVESVSLHLATHYDQAGMPNEAISCYQRAAIVAEQRFAHKKAAAMLHRALAICRSWPESARRDDLELELLVTLGPKLVATLGYGVGEVGETYRRALELSRPVGERHHLPFILCGSWMFHVVRGELETSRQFGQELVDFARGEESEALAAAGNFTLGSSLFHLGELHLSEQHMTRTISTYDKVPHAALALFAGPDIGVFGRSYLAHVLWHLGFPDRASAAVQDALDAASQLGHPFSMAIALDYAAILFSFRRESKTALEHARKAIEVCRKYDFAYYRSIAEIVAGWASALEHQATQGWQQLRGGLAMLKSTGAELRLPFYHGLLAEVCALNGATGEALANLSTAFAFQSKNGEMWSAADLHRLHGDLLRKNGSTTQAELSYRKSLDAARRAGSATGGLAAQTRLAELAGETRGRPEVGAGFTWSSGE